MASSSDPCDDIGVVIPRDINIYIYTLEFLYTHIYLYTYVLLCGPLTLLQFRRVACSWNGLESNKKETQESSRQSISKIIPQTVLALGGLILVLYSNFLWDAGLVVVVALGAQA